MRSRSIVFRLAPLALLLAAAAIGQPTTQGTLRVRDERGIPQAECPLARKSFREVGVNGGRTAHFVVDDVLRLALRRRFPPECRKKPGRC